MNKHVAQDEKWALSQLHDGLWTEQEEDCEEQKPHQRLWLMGVFESYDYLH